MPELGLVCAAVVGVGVGTYLFRWAGPALPERVTTSPRVKRTANDAAVLLLAGVLAATALTQDQHFAGQARVLGVAVAGLLALRGLPFVVVILTAAVVAALGRAAGLS